MTDHEKLDALIDGELEASERAEVEAAIASNPALAAEMQSLHALKQCLQTNIKPVPADDVWRDCVKRLDAIDKTRKAEIFVGKYAWALCALFFVAIVSGGMLNRMNASNRIGTDDLARMQSNLSPVSLPSVSSAEGIKTWLKGLLGRSPNTVPYKEKMQVVGGSKGVVEGHPVVKLDLKDSRGNLALLIFPGVSSMDGLTEMDRTSFYSAGRVGDLNGVAWTHDNFLFLLVGERPAEDLRSVAISLDPSTAQ